MQHLKNELDTQEEWSFIPKVQPLLGLRTKTCKKTISRVQPLLGPRCRFPSSRLPSSRIKMD
jgi:hypothetical protein